jgi:acyl-coenzyme A synthetase/AMP-(fatty) acid ligase
VIAELNRLTHPALLSLLEHTTCFRWLGGSEAQTALGETLTKERPGTRLSTLPPLNYWLEDGDVPNYPFEKTWEEAKMNPTFVIHSSGTTGVPKPLRYTLENAAVQDFMHRSLDGSYENTNLMFGPMFDARLLWCAPPQWLGGIMGHLWAPLFWESVTIWPPVHEGSPTSSSVIAEIIQKYSPDGAFFVPSTVRDLCSHDHSLELTKRLKFIIYGGAPLDDWVGDLLCTELDLLVVVGSTETNLWPLQTLKDPRDWRYYWIDERLGHRLEHFQDDLYELVIDRKPEYRRFQGAFHIFPETDIWYSQDLYSPHPEKPGLLRYRGRKDDLVKLVWLTKVRAGDMEGALSRDPRIAEAMVGGEGKPTPFVILQLTPSSKQPDEEEIWRIVNGLNEVLSAEVHIPRENIILASPDKPLRKLGKGTLDRRGILADYEREIAWVYHEASPLNEQSE